MVVTSSVEVWPLQQVSLTFSTTQGASNSSTSLRVRLESQQRSNQIKDYSKDSTRGRASSTGARARARLHLEQGVELEFTVMSRMIAMEQR